MPTYGRCEGVGAWEIREGYYGDTRLDGVRFVRAFSWPGAIHEGNGTRLLIVDQATSSDQRKALLALESGTQGGIFFEIFAAMCPNVLEPIFAPIRFEADRERRTARVLIPDVFESQIEPIRNPKTGEELRGRIVLPNGFEFKEAEVANTVRFEVKKPHGVVMRHENSYAQLSAFDWSN